MKSILKKIPAVYAANSFIKDISLSLESAWINRSYPANILNQENLPNNGDIRAMLHDRQQEQGTRPVIMAKSPLHIYFVGTYYDHEAFGFLQALKRLGNVTLHYDIHGQYGINSSIHKDGSPATDADNRFLVEQISALHDINHIDFVIGTFVASTISVDTLLSIRKMGIPVINYAMDDILPIHWRTTQGVKMGAIGLIDGVDLTLQTTARCVPRYLSGGCPCVYWPFASDPDIYSPGRAKDLDVVFVGNNYGKRSALTGAIQSAGVRVECYGTGFPNGHLPGERVAEIFSRAKIILGTGLVGHSSRIVTLKLRDFDAPMSGTLYITNHNPDLETLFDIGKEIVTFRSIRECIEKIKYYLGNDKERESIAAAGWARALRDHTWDSRFSKLLQLLAPPTHHQPERS